MAAEALAPLRNLAGTWLGQFELIKMLGIGGMGAVYLATDSILRREVALKVMTKGGEFNDSERRDRILREARAAARLVHPNVVQIFQIGEDESFRFIAMEYVEGTTIGRAAKANGGRLSEQFGIERMREAANALKLTESLGICHRDIKPANLLLTTSGMLKVADFGLAAQIDGSETIGPASDVDLEGTPFYMSPEQWARGPILPASDIYSLGCTMYHLLTGGTPYPARDLISCFGAHCLSPIPDPRLKVPDMDPILADLLMRCMAKKPDDRPTAGEIVHRLDDMLELRRSSVMARSGIEQSPVPASTRSIGPPSVIPPSSVLTISVGRASVPPSSRMQSLSIIPMGEVGTRSYQEWFRLKDYPFSDIRQPSSFWDAGAFSWALYSLGTQILAGERPTMLVGAPGSGRTFVCEMLRHRFPQFHLSSVEPQLLFGTRLLVSVCRHLGATGISTSASQRLLIQALIEYTLPKDRPDAVAVVVVDGVDPDARDVLLELDDILGSAPAGRFAMVLVGAEDLPERLVERGAPERLCRGPQPVALRGMTQQEMVEYIDFRVKTIGSTTKVLELDAASRQFLHARTGGNPKLVNIYCHNALTIAALKQETTVRFSTVRAGTKSNSYLTPASALELLQQG